MFRMYRGKMNFNKFCVYEFPANQPGCWIQMTASVQLQDIIIMWSSSKKIMEDNVSFVPDVKEEENSSKIPSDFAENTIKGKQEIKEAVASSSGKQLYFHSDFSFLDSDEEVESKSTKASSWNQDW